MKGILVELPLIYFFWEVQIQKLGTEIYDQQVPDGQYYREVRIDKRTILLEDKLNLAILFNAIIPQLLVLSTHESVSKLNEKKKEKRGPKK